MQKKHNSSDLKLSFAFSLAELSVVLIIIGLLMASITYGTKLIKTSKLIKAKTYTESSPIWSISDINGKRSAVLWLDTIDTDSITTTINGDSKLVTKWRSKVGGSAIQTGVTSIMPEFKEKGLDPYPSIYFDGGDQLTISLSPLVESDDTYSIAIVWQTENDSTAILFQQGIATNRRAALVQFAEGQYGFNGMNNDANLIKDYNLNQLTSSIITIDNSLSNNVALYHNLEDKIETNTASPSTLDLEVGNAYISGQNDSTVRFTGHLAEIIIFRSALSEDEAKSVALYLTTKYQIR